jgi:hypothetical protein
MNKKLLLVFLGLLFGFAGGATAGSDDKSLSCVKEVPNPMSLAVRQNYVMSCVSKADDLTITKISANDGACACSAYNSITHMKLRDRFMVTCVDAGNPCDFTEVRFETSAGEIVLTWDPESLE